MPGSEPAARAESVIREGLADLAGVEGKSFGLRAEAALTEPIALFTVDADRLRASRDADALVQIGWRIIIHDPSAGVRYADASGSGEDLRFARLVSGKRAEAMVAAGERAKTGPDHRSLRIVETSRLKIAALWLDGDEPTFIPFAGMSGEPLGEAAFLAALADQLALQAQAAGDVGEAESLFASQLQVDEPAAHRRGLGMAVLAAASVAGSLAWAVVRLGRGRRASDAVTIDQDDDGPTASSG